MASRASASPFGHVVFESNALAECSLRQQQEETSTKQRKAFDELFVNG
jgi:hypothetical protein